MSSVIAGNRSGRAGIGRLVTGRMIGRVLLTPWLLVPCFVAAFAAPLVASPTVIRRVLRRGGRADRDGPPRDAP